jgi:tetratricopeptide (TPR) repeat protein
MGRLANSGRSGRGALYRQSRPTTGRKYNLFSIAALSQRGIPLATRRVFCGDPKVMHRLNPISRWLCLAALIGCSAIAIASEHDEVNRLLRGGQKSEALQRADRYLLGKPGDAQMRFLKGVILTELKQYAQALDVFAKLTQDYPELAEPYNNLAVLHAAQGQYEEARQALETAVRNDPNYAVAQENLGDVYAMLASVAYARAVALDPANATIPPKLTLIRELLSARHRTLGGPAPPAGTPPS